MTISRRNLLQGLGAITAGVLSGCGLPLLKNNEVDDRHTYILFEDLPLAEYGNRIPNITTVLFKKPIRIGQTKTFSVANPYGLRSLFPTIYAEEIRECDITTVLDDQGHVFRGYQYFATYACITAGDCGIEDIWLDGKKADRSFYQVVQSDAIPRMDETWIDAIKRDGVLV